MRTRKSDVEIFSVSLIDLISGALGIMSILFFAIIPLISESNVINNVNQINPINDEKQKFVSLHILHKKLHEVIVDEIVGDRLWLKSDYFITNDTALFKASFVIPENSTSETISIKIDGNAIYAGSFITMHGEKQKQIYIEANTEKYRMNLN